MQPLIFTPLGPVSIRKCRTSCSAGSPTAGREMGDSCGCWCIPLCLSSHVAGSWEGLCLAGTKAQETHCDPGRRVALWGGSMDREGPCWEEEGAQRVYEPQLSTFPPSSWHSNVMNGDIVQSHSRFFAQVRGEARRLLSATESGHCFI